MKRDAAMKLLHSLNLLKRFVKRQSRRASRPEIRTEQLERRQLLVAPQEPVTVDTVEFTSSTTIIDWDSASNADRYDLWFTLAGFEAQPINRSGRNVDNNIVTESRFEASGLRPSFGRVLDPLTNPGVRFRLWIRAGNDDGFGPWGPGRDFILPGTPEDKPDLDVARNSFYGRTDSFTVSWTSLVEAQNADTHEIWVAKDGQRIVNEEQVGATYTSGTLDPGIYRFWVRGESDQLTGAWSDGLTIAVGSDQPELTGPVVNEAPNRPEFTWDTGVPGVPYQLWVQNENGLLINQSAIAGTSLTPDADLADGVYSAWVRQVPANGQPLPWSSRYQFAVGQSSLPEIPVLQFTENLNGDAVEDRRAIFSWDAAANTARYELFIADTDTGIAVVRRSDITDTAFTTDVLPANTYRAWLRSIGPNGEVSLWSEFIQFGVASDTGEVILFN